MKYKKQIITAVIAAVLAAAVGMGGYTWYIRHRTSGTQKEEPKIQDGAGMEEAAAPLPVTLEPKKEETVYVKADARGTVKNIIVSDILRNGTFADTISDRSDLTDIKNVKGKETFKKGENGELIWQADGKDIYYQGKSEKTLPVELKVTYYLEGKEIEPEALAGKAGNIKIRFEYVNHEVRTVAVGGEERSIATPFIAVTGLFLDEEKFMNVEMENGKVISDGSRIMAGGIAVPGLADSIALSEVEDMEELDVPEYLELTAYTTGFELPMTMTAITSDFAEDMDLDDLDTYEDLKDDMQELKDASVELVDGTHELVDGVIELQDGAAELYDGAVELDDGAKELQDGAVELDDGAYDLRDGALELKDALKAYNEGMNTLLAAMANADGNGNDITVVAAQLTAGVEQVVEQVADTLLTTANASVKPLEPLGIPQFDGVGEFVEYDFSELAQYEALGAIPGGTVAALEAAQQQLDAAQLQLAALRDGMNQLSEGISQVYGGVATQLQPAAVQILDGARELYDGTKDLKDGTEELLDGTNELKDGTVELLDGTVELKDGVQELYDGSIELRDGMEEFDEDGIQKLYDMVNKDFQGVIDRARAVVDEGEAYQTFTQISPDMKGSVKFLIETEAIE